jgi:RNase adaptor protein for sRNA GlmZ degradation
MTAGDDDFQFHTASAKTTSTKRVYIGGLPKNHPNLETELQEWLQEQLPDLKISSIQVNSRGKAPHALVDCGTQANSLISKLHQKVWQSKKLVVQREKRNNKPKGPPRPNNPLLQKSWSQPTKAVEFTPIPVDEASEHIQSVVSKEFQQAEDFGEDPINVALASTAAVSLLASMGAFQDDQVPLGVNDNYDDDNKANEPEEPDFGFQMKPMADLMADFGQADPNWQKQQVAEVVEKKAPPTSRLALKGKAPIHICFSSFGYKHGAPKRMDGWSHRQPLLPYDCREFPSVPQHLEWGDGLSGGVKRAFLQQGRGMEDFCQKIIAKQVWDCLIDAQNDGGHGYASPLEMIIYIGSESGRHRGVVVSEWAAAQLRNLLRENEHGVMQQPVSVGTQHREVAASRQKKSNPKKSTKQITAEFAGEW